MITVSEVYSIIVLAVALIFAGTLLILIDMLRRPMSGMPSTGKRTEVGGVVIVGPIPIVFGSSGSITKVVLILAIVLTVLAIALTLVWHTVVR